MEKVLQTREKRGKLRVTNGWLLCECGHKLLRVTQETRAENLEVYCRHCKRRHKVNIDRGESS